MELRREGSSALKGWAEIYAPEGVFIKAADAGVAGLLRDGEPLQLGGFVIEGCTFEGCRIGIHARRSGISIGVA
jgi:hypothetical protein